MNTPSSYDLGWLVGFYEGEGSCLFQPGHLTAARTAVTGATIQVHFSQKDIEPLRRVQAILGISGYLYLRERASILTYSGRQARALLVLMRPHLSARRQAQIGKAIDAYDARPLTGKRRRGNGQFVPATGQLRLLA